MRVVVIGASGNVGSAVVRSLAGDEAVTSIVGVARRRPQWSPGRTEWVAADVARDDLVPVLRGADAVVHLAWMIQPSRDLRTLWRNNVEGSARVLAAVARADVPALVYASSIGAYAPAPAGVRRIDESWPTTGVPSNHYSREKAAVERMADGFEQRFPHVRVIRMRKALVFSREAATGIRRLFAGPLLPGALLRPEFIPVVPDIGGLVTQAVHSRDAASAYHAAIVGDARGAFNIASEPPLDGRGVAELLNARAVQVPRQLAWYAAAAAWRMRLVPIRPSWLDLAIETPLLDTSRAREELAWQPQWSAGDALLDLLTGLREGDGLATPPLDPDTSGPLRIRELATGVGARGGI